MVFYFYDFGRASYIVQTEILAPPLVPSIATDRPFQTRWMKKHSSDCCSLCSGIHSFALHTARSSENLS